MTIHLFVCYIVTRFDLHKQLIIEKKVWQKAKFSLINVSFDNLFFVIYHLQTQFSRPILLLRLWD